MYPSVYVPILTSIWGVKRALSHDFGRIPDCTGLSHNLSTVLRSFEDFLKEHIIYLDFPVFSYVSQHSASRFSQKLARQSIIYFPSSLSVVYINILITNGFRRFFIDWLFFFSRTMISLITDNNQQFSSRTFPRGWEFYHEIFHFRSFNFQLLKTIYSVEV